MSEAEVITFGCRLNTFESEVLRRNARAAGVVDAVIINTCAVTTEAERQARQAIRRARRRRPGARIIVTGCSAQTDPARYAAMPEVDLVLGNAEKLEPVALGEGARVRVADIAGVRARPVPPIEGLSGRTRAILHVQNGCDHRCTFCIIPLARGPSRSVPAAEVIGQARTLAAKGFRECVLTGVDLTAYGNDLPGGPALGDMVRKLLAEVPEIERLRLSSLDVSEVDRALLEILATEPRLMPHLHLSLQSGDDLILKRMKRRHRRAEAVAFCAKLRALRPDVTFGADLIVGFPTETSEAFERTLALVDDCGLTFLHVFPYSSRPGTAAARMPQGAVAERKERARRLRARGQAALDSHLLARQGSVDRVLVETASERGAIGHGEDYVPVRLDGRVPIGAIARARITGLEPGGLVGRLF